MSETNKKQARVGCGEEREPERRGEGGGRGERREGDGVI